MCIYVAFATPLLITVCRAPPALKMGPEPCENPRALGWDSSSGRDDNRMAFWVLGSSSPEYLGKTEPERKL